MRQPALADPDFSQFPWTSAHFDTLNLIFFDYHILHTVVLFGTTNDTIQRFAANNENHTDKTSQKFLNKAERSDYKLYLRLKDAVDSIPELLRNHQGDIKQLVGEKGLYRLRVWNVRIIFHPEFPAELIIEGIDFRGNIF